MADMRRILLMMAALVLAALPGTVARAQD